MPLRYLFLDMNSFFASVEQQEQPELRGKPVGVVPVLTGRTCCIAASYEAKAYGVKTGTGVFDARDLCPNVRFALARPKLYVEYHHEIIAAMESCMHVEDVCSIDEMYGKLYLNERDEGVALGIAHNIKRAIADRCGKYVRCSVGIAPNIWLAKVATDLEKPDGLAIVHECDAKEKLSTLKLRDLPGIGSGMHSRLMAYGINSVEGLYGLTERELSHVWGSKIHGSQWWQKLRGADVYPKETSRRTVGHSHVLPPEFRNTRDAYGVVVRMIHKAAYRLRKIGYWTEKISVSVRFLGSKPRWKRVVKIKPTCDTITLVRIMTALWRTVPSHVPLKVSVTLSDLLPNEAVSLPLFPEDIGLIGISSTMDRINQKYTAQTIYLAAMHDYRTSAPERIAFTQIPDLESFAVS